MLRLACSFILLVLLAACARPASFPHVETLDPDNAKTDGERLIELPHGLHRLDRNRAPRTAHVMVHGHGSRGLEWVYPIVRLHGPDIATYFFRWDWNGCPGPAAEALGAALNEALGDDPTLTAVTVLGHSYGGIVTHEFVRLNAARVPITAHVIASPLAGIEVLTGRCGYAPMSAAENFHEWRTQHALDGAFKDMPVDPQDVTIDGSEVTRLPGTYRGQRLGHNWSMSWVADALAERVGGAVNRAENQ